MRINKISLGVIVILVIFYSYLGYREFFTDHQVRAINSQEDKNTSATKKLQDTPALDYGEMRAKIAIEEYSKNVFESPKGCNCGPEIDTYTESSPGQWCTMFASWITKQAGSPVVNEKTGSWKITNSRVFTEYLKTYGTFYTKEQIIRGNLQPQVGDFIIFYRGNFEDSLGHIDIVVSDTARDGKADLIGGNYRDTVNYRKDFPYLDYYGFLGFGRPEKE